MGNVLDKWTATVELFKAGNARQDISKSIKVNRMLVWRTLKRYEESEDIQNTPGQDRPRTARTPKLAKYTSEKIRRNPKRSIQNLAKETNLSYETMSTVPRKDRKMSPFKHVKKHQLSAQVVDKRFQRCKILLSRIEDGMLPNLVFSDEKKFDVEHHFNTQNNRVWSRNRDEGSRVVVRKQCPASVTIWAEVTESGRSSLIFVDQEMKLNQQNYRDDILWCIVALGTRALQKSPLAFSAGLCTITWGQKDSGVALGEFSARHYQRGMSLTPIFSWSESSGFWDLVIPWEQDLDCLPWKF